MIRKKNYQTLKTIKFNGVILKLPTIKNKIQYMLNAKTLEWNCKNIFFPNNILNEIDSYVNIGANNGYESIIPALMDKVVINIESNIKLIGCMDYTFLGFDNVTNINAAYSEEIGVKFYPDYKSNKNESASVKRGGNIEAINLSEIIKKIGDKEKTLMQMNIEGGEIELLRIDKIPEKIKIINISCHDFLADRGEGQELRTYKKIKHYLEKQGFEESEKKIWGKDYLDSWSLFRRN